MNVWSDSNHIFRTLKQKTLRFWDCLSGILDFDILNHLQINELKKPITFPLFVVSLSVSILDFDILNVDQWVNTWPSCWWVSEWVTLAGLVGGREMCPAGLAYLQPHTGCMASFIWPCSSLNYSEERPRPFHNQLYQTLAAAPWRNFFFMAPEVGMGLRKC